MPTHRTMRYSRRRFLRELALTGTAGILSLPADRAAAEPPPETTTLRLLVNTAIDRPWSHYFCCTVAGNREFVRRHPVATQRTLRALLKAADVCALAPARAAQLMVKKGAATSYEYALQSLQEIPYDRWRDYDPEDTVRFYALRLRDAGMIDSIPQKIIAKGTDWRFLNQLKKELKA